MTNAQFLRMPPFPRMRPARPLPRDPDRSDGWTLDQGDLVTALRAAKVGGQFWGIQPENARGRLLLAPTDMAMARDMLGQARDAGRAEDVMILAPRSLPLPKGIYRVPPAADPWFLMTRCEQVWAGADSEVALVAAIEGKLAPGHVFGGGRFASLRDHTPDRVAELARDCIVQSGFTDPFTGAPMAPMAAIALLAQWRRLIDSNRSISAIFGVARWKRVTMDALLWDGSGPVRHRPARTSILRRLPADRPVIAWQTRVPPAFLARLDQSGVHIGEIEDGMIRSTGLGANCVPPLSVTVDFDGAHFDPSRVSGLEKMLADCSIDDAMRARAAALRHRLVAEGISKYGLASPIQARVSPGVRRVLVTGQVEDDRSVRTGGGGMTNLELLRRARAHEEGTYIIYKPHPDVEAGHRRGHVPDAQALQYADAIDRTSAITTLLAQVDGLHVITSLAGFEALMRGISVTTHGVPFYAGWGLTEDLGPVPSRRTTKRSLDELVAITLILYPRCLDPVTRLPCTTELLVDRIAAGQARVTSPLVRLREWQGRLKQWVQGRGGAR
ncbi:MAG: hypothetical protein RIS94_297 [Pseudomonadota bacterium]